MEQEVEHQINDDKKHNDSDDVSGIQGFASWTLVLVVPTSMPTVEPPL